MALEYISMANSFNVPQKGGNICGKFVSTQNSRNAIYNSVSTDLSPLNIQQQKLAGAFENIVAGVAKTLENTNTGWTIDSEFKDGENIKPEITLPTISTNSIETQIETWNYNNTTSNILYDAIEPPSTTQDIGFPVVFTDKVGQIYICGYQKNSNGDTVLNVRYCNDSGQTTSIKTFTVENASRLNSNQPYQIRPIAGGSFVNNNNEICIKIFCIFANLQVTELGVSRQRYYGVLTTTGANSNNTYIIPNQSTSSSPTPATGVSTPSWPVLKAKWDKYRNIFVGAFRDSTVSSKIYFFNDVGPGYMYRNNVSSSFFISISGTNAYSTSYNNTTGIVTIDKRDPYDYSGAEAFCTIQSNLNNEPYMEYFDFSYDYQYFVVIFSKGYSKEFVIREYNNPSQDYCRIQTVLEGDSFNYLISQQNIYIFMRGYSGLDSDWPEQGFALNIAQKQINPYITVLSNNIRIYGLYYDKKLYCCGANDSQPTLTIIDNFVTTNEIIETEEDVPLSAHVNLTHSSQNKLQISCQYNSKKQLLFDNDNNALYGNDIGFAFLNKDSDMSFETVPSLHICKNNDGTPAGGLFYNEIISNVGIGDLTYYIVASKDGDFIDLMVKSQRNTIIANIGCGNLINKLYYPEVDIDANAHVMYFALGFVKSDLSAVPDNTNPNNLVAIFMAPTYNGFRYYSGTNNVSSLDLVYKCQTSSYKYHGTLNLTLTYTMPLILAITGTNTVYYFNGESGFKGEINRAYLVQIKPENSIDAGVILDNGNYLYLGNLWAIGWDSSNKAALNPYYTEG